MPKVVRDEGSRSQCGRKADQVGLPDQAHHRFRPRSRRQRGTPTGEWPRDGEERERKLRSPIQRGSRGACRRPPGQGIHGDILRGRGERRLQEACTSRRPARRWAETRPRRQSTRPPATAVAQADGPAAAGAATRAGRSPRRRQSRCGVPIRPAGAKTRSGSRPCGVRRASAAPFARSHRLDDGRPSGAIGRRSSARSTARRCSEGTGGVPPVEVRPSADPHRSGVAPSFHQPPVALGTALEGLHTPRQRIRSPSRSCTRPANRHRAGSGPRKACQWPFVGSRQAVTAASAAGSAQLGESLHRQLRRRCTPPRDRYLGSPELCRGESRREEHRRRRPPTGRAGPRHPSDESPLRETTGAVRSGPAQRDPRGEKGARA